MGNKKQKVIPYYKRDGKTTILYFAGISGSGKTYNAFELLKKYPKYFNKPLQITTRDPREGEVEGVDYLFLNEKSYYSLSSNRKLFSRTKIGNNYYGTLKSYLDPKKINIVVVDYSGYMDGLGVKFIDKNDYQKILIGFEYTYNIKDKLRSRGKRDQVDNYKYFKNNVEFDKIFVNESDNFIKTKDLLKEIKKICYDKGYYNILYRNRW